MPCAPAQIRHDVMDVLPQFVIEVAGTIASV
jgi:hypothetical protein